MHGARGMVYHAITDTEERRSSFGKFVSAETVKAIESRLETKPGDLLLIVADKPAVVFESLARFKLISPLLWST
jgi:aspartyl-tRNA synthetase